VNEKHVEREVSRQKHAKIIKLGGTNNKNETKDAS
jgi:hypothetical protein